MKKKLNPKLKLAALVILTSVTAASNEILVPAAELIIVLTFGMLVKNRLNINRRLKPLAIIGLGIVLFQLVFNTSISPADRIITGTTAVMKIAALSLLVLLFTSTTSADEIISALSFLPRKLKFVLTISLSLIPVILNETEIITAAQKARGLKTGLNPVNNVTPVIIPLLHRSLLRAEKLAIAALSRGYET